MQKELIDFKPIALWRVFVNSFETQPKDGHGHHHHPSRLSQGITCNLQLVPKKKENRTYTNQLNDLNHLTPHPNQQLCFIPIPPPFLSQRHRDHHLLPCDATQLLVALPQGVGGKVKPSSKATWWKSKQLKPESSGNRKGVEIEVIIIPGGLEKQKIVWSCNLYEYNIYHICI